MTMLFMKIDANSDGTVDWDEFSTYMMTGAMETDYRVNLDPFFSSCAKKFTTGVDWGY